MPVGTIPSVRITRWRGGQHPTLDKITRMMQQEGLRPYVWTNMPNFRYPVRSHGYDKTLFCAEGSLEIYLPQTKQRVMLRAGDRVELPQGVRYSAIVGPTGAQCVEGSAL